MPQNSNGGTPAARWARVGLLLLLIVVMPLAATCGRPPTPTLREPTITPTPPTPQRSSISDDVRFEHISLEQGLSQSIVLCILQDNQGFMWFGTEDGLNRYDGYKFTVYKRDPDDSHSLSKGTIERIYQDRAGGLWIVGGFGGDSSIDKYDRETGRFAHYMLYDTTDPESADSDFVWALYEDSGGTLWVGTYRNGLHRYDQEADRFVRYRYNPEDPYSLSSDRVYAIYEDRAGTLWVGTKEGLNRFDRETERFTHYRHDPDDPQSLGSDVVQLIFEDQAGRFWVATLGVGLEQWDREGERVVARYQHDPDDPSTIDAPNRILGVYEDRLGLWWVVHFDRRLDRLDPQTGKFTRYRHDPENPHSLVDGLVSFVTEDRSGNLWIGTSGGLERYDREKDRFIHYRHDPDDPYSLSDDALITFYEDQAGILWIGTDGHGLNLYDPHRIKFAHYLTTPDDPDGAESDTVYAIYEDGAGTLWIGTSAGLTRLERGKDAWTQYRHDPDDPTSLSPGVVASIYEDREGALWVGTQGGLDKLDRATGQFTHYQQVEDQEVRMLQIGTVFSILQDRAGVLWLGKYREGLCKFDRETGECTLYLAAPDDALSPLHRISQVYEDRAGVLWVGSEGGLLKFDREAEAFTTYERDPDDPASLSGEDVLSIYEDRSGGLWVGTNGGGLNRFNRAAETFVHYTEKDGLPSNVVLGILEEDPAPDGSSSHLWLSTSNGLSRFDPQTETFRNYDQGDGLQSDEFTEGAFYKGTGGEMFFGGVNGINAFYPGDIRDNPYVPPVVLTTLTQGGADVMGDRAIEGVNEITLKWPNTFFEFEFAALSYSQPEKNRYAYLLEGFDDGWNDVGTKRFGRYTNLPGGTYTLRLKGSNYDGVWNEEGVSLAVTVVPPLWETWWFRGVIALLLLGGVIVGYRLRVRGVEARSRELEAQVADRTKELAALNTIATTLSRSLDMQEALDDALDKTLEVMNVEAGGIYLLDERAKVLDLVAQRGFRPEHVPEIDKLKPGEGFSGRVVQSGEPLVVRDVSSDPRLTRLMVREEGLRSLAVVPLAARGQVLGTLFTITHGYREFTERDERMLGSIGHQIGTAIESTRLFDAVQRRAEQLWVIQEVGRSVASILDVDELLDQMAGLIQEAFGYYLVEIGLIEGDELVFLAGSGETWAGEFESFRLKVGQEGLTGQVAASGEPLIVPDVSREPRYVSVTEVETRSELAVPIKAKEQIIGVINIESDRLNAFDESDLAVLQSLAHQAAIAIENARLYEDTQSRVAQLTALQETTKAVVSTLELDRLLNLIIQQAATLLQADGGIINLVDWDKREDQVVATTGLIPVTLGERSLLEGSLSGWVTLHNQPIISNHILNDDRVDRSVLSWAAEERVQSAAIAPLTIKDRVMGTLVAIGQEGGKGEFAQADLDLLVAFANQAATAIENVRLFDAEQRRAEQFRVISEVGRHITSILDVDELLREIVRLLKEAFGYYLITVGVIEDGQVVFKAGAKDHWPEPQFIPPSRAVGGEGITAWVASTGEPYLTPDVSQDPHYLFWPDAAETRSELAVPLRTKADVIGVLNVESDRLNAFDESDVEVLQSLANQAAIAVENARLYEQARQIAVVEERSRLARELHDSVTQSLYSSTLLAEAGRRLARTGDLERVNEYLSRLGEITQQALKEMRLLVYELRPPVLKESGLVGALNQRLDAVERRAGIEARLMVEGTLELAEHVEEALYRIAQEALNNALKHASPTSVTVTLHVDGECVVLEVADDGRGFDPQAVSDEGGMGLVSIRERTDKLGGTLAIRSAPGEGTQITVRVKCT